jgi:hypothetical protein
MMPGSPGRSATACAHVLNTRSLRGANRRSSAQHALSGDMNAIAIASNVTFKAR